MQNETFKKGRNQFSWFCATEYCHRATAERWGAGCLSPQLRYLRLGDFTDQCSLFIFCGLTDRIEQFLGHCRCSNLVSEKQSIHTAMSDTTKLSCLCRVRFGGVNWIPDNSILSLTENWKSEHVNSNCPIHTTTPDTTQTTISSCLLYAEIRWFNGFQNGSCSPSWIFEIHFLMIWEVKRTFLKQPYQIS